MKYINLYILSLIIAFTCYSCDSVLDTEPEQSIDTENLITDANSANVAMNGLYSSLQDFYGSTSHLIIDLASDISIHSGTFPRLRDVNDNKLAINGAATEMWNEMYKTIYNANLIIQLLPDVNDPSLAEDKNRMVGEARFIRALNYYYLVNLFGEVPLITQPLSTLNDVNNPKVDPSLIFDVIIEDLNAAVANVPSHGDRKRVSKAAANALLSKVYLVLRDWSLASDKAALAIEDSEGDYVLEDDYADLFSGSISNEAIFQIPFNASDQSMLAFYYWHTPGGRHEMAPSEEYVMSFRSNDLRAVASFSSILNSNSPYFVNKYKDFASGADYPFVLRLADILLVKAEADAEQGKYIDANTSINLVRNRAGLSDITLNMTNFKAVILEERKLELAFEGGNRWLDMLRSGLADQYLIDKGLDPCRTLFPIPQSEIDANPALKQNPCY